MAVSKRLRYEVLRRDDYRCRYCGKTALQNELTVDHVTPSALGGSDRPENLVACCRDCNAGKTSSSPDSPLVANVTDDALRWSAAMRRAAEIQAAEVADVEQFLSEFRGYWMTFTYGEGHTLEEFLPNDWSRTVETWMTNGVALDELRYAVRVAMTNSNVKAKDVWRYTCGVIWRQLDKRQEMARELLAIEEAQPAPTNPEPYAPPKTTWLNGDLAWADTLQPVKYPKLVWLFDDAATYALAAKSEWPDCAQDEVLWGYPRYYNALGIGLQHRLNAITNEYRLEQDDAASCQVHLLGIIEDGFAEAA